MAKKTAKADKPITAETPTKPLSEFIESVNKKDKMNGLRIRFGFTKRKR
jgi:hypothetical protein